MSLQQLKILKRLNSIFIVGVCLSLVVSLAGLTLISQVGAAPNIVEAQVGKIDFKPIPERSVMYGADGSIISYLSFEENRSAVPSLSDIPQDVIMSVLAVEDEAFYYHDGINFQGITRAAVTNAMAGGVEQGGSTITQQLVKNAVLTSEQSLERKISEALIARHIEKQLSKDEILLKYLNTIYFGSSAYGVQAAAETYWGYKSASELTMCDGALLAGMIRGPNQTNPTRHQDNARNRRNVVLNRLLALEKITEEEAVECRESSLPLERQTPVDTKPTTYFAEEVLQRLLKDDNILKGKTQNERFDMIYGGGLEIYTTLDPKAQAAADKARDTFVPENQKRFTTSLVSVDSHTGAVKALVGGPGFEIEKFNIATQGNGQQTGSTFKTIVLAALFEAGYVSSDTVRADTPCTFKEPSGQPYTVNGGGAGGRKTVAAVTRSSYNCAFVRLGQVVGNDKVVEMSRRLGITTIPEEAGEYLSLPLGVQDVYPIELTGAYATFFNDGEHNEPWFIEKIVDPKTNETIYEHTAKPDRAVSKNTARMIIETLEDNVDRSQGDGTGRKAAVEGQFIAGKTGTTNDFVSAWFAGGSDYYTTIVWVGHPDGNKSIERNALNLEAYPEGVSIAYGGNVSGPIFSAYMTDVHEGLDPVEFKKPTEVVSRGQYLKVQGESERSVTCPPVPEGVRTRPVDVDGDGRADCLLPIQTPAPTNPGNPTVPPTTEDGGNLPVTPPTTGNPATPTTIPTVPTVSLPPRPTVSLPSLPIDTIGIPEAP